MERDQLNSIANIQLGGLLLNCFAVGNNFHFTGLDCTYAHIIFDWSLSVTYCPTCVVMHIFDWSLSVTYCPTCRETK